MKEKKVIVSVRFPSRILAEIDKFASVWKFRDRSKFILYAVGFFLRHFTPEDWKLYHTASGAQLKEAWDAFWSAIRSTGVKSNTNPDYDSTNRP